MAIRSKPDKRGASPSKAALADGQEAQDQKVPAEARYRMIQVEAYYLAERRGFCPGCELEDWLAAEALVNARLGTQPGR